MKSAVVGAIVVCVIVLVLLVVPWYPVVTSQNVTQSITFTYQVATQTYQLQNIYSLPSPITLQGFFQSGSTSSQAFQDLGDVALQANSLVAVEVNQCQNCDLGISKDFGDKATVYSVLGSSFSGDFLVPDSGQYKISVGNLGNTVDQVTSIVITANIPQNIMASQVGYNTVEVTTYSVDALAPSLIIGLLPSLAILGVIALVVVVLVLFDRGFLIMTKRRRRRRR